MDYFSFSSPSSSTAAVTACENSSSSANNDTCQEVASSQIANTYNPRKRNLVWQNVIDEERVKETCEEMDAVTMIDKFVIKRGSESYLVGNKRKNKSPEEILKEAEKDEDSDLIESDSNISSDDLSGEETKEAVKNQIKIKKKANRKTKEKDRKTGQKLLEEKLTALEDHKVPTFIAKKLKENRNKFHLFIRANKIFGRKVMLEKLRKTLKIERSGGMMTKTKGRKRTPGGVFLNLLKNDTRLPQHKRDEVFSYDKEVALAKKRTDKNYQLSKTIELALKGKPDIVGHSSDAAKVIEKEQEEEIAIDEEMEFSYPVIPDNPPIKPVTVPEIEKVPFSAVPFSSKRGRELVSYDDLF